MQTEAWPPTGADRCESGFGEGPVPLAGVPHTRGTLGGAEEVPKGNPGLQQGVAESSIEKQTHGNKLASMGRDKQPLSPPASCCKSHLTALT